PFNGAHWHRARSRGRSVDVNGAGTTLGNTAAVFRAGEPNLLPQHPEQRSALVDINVVGLSVDAETSHSQPPVDRQFIAMTVDPAVTGGSACARHASITWFHSKVDVAKRRGPAARVSDGSVASGHAAAAPPSSMMNWRRLTFGNSRRVSARGSLHPWKWRTRRWHVPSKCRNGSTPSPGSMLMLPWR